MEVKNVDKRGGDQRYTDLLKLFPFVENYRDEY